MAYDLEAAIRGARAAEDYMARRNIRGGWTNAVIVDRALERGLSVEPDTRRRVRLSDGQRRHWFFAGNSSLNRSMARKCVHHKEVASGVMRLAGVSVPENLVFDAGDADRAWDWAQPVLPIVLKPQNANSGSMVYVEIHDRAEFQDAFDAIAVRYGRVLVEEYVAGVEHRVLMIGGSVAAVVRRVPAHVVGDGTADVATLIQQKNALRLAASNPLHGEIRIDEMVARELRKQALTMNSVPLRDRVVPLRATSNVHTGGDIVDATEELSAGEVKFVKNAARAIPGLYMGGFDVLLPRGGDGSRPCVLEGNASPMIAMHHFPWRGKVRDAAGRLLDAMFPMVGTG